jgi:hypothetical protein
MNNIPFLLKNKGGLNAIQPIVKTSRMKNKNNNKRSLHEQKKNDVKTTAAILRIQQQRKT